MLTFSHRFSKDTETIDTEIVESLQPVFDYGAQVIMVAVVISVILPVFLIPGARPRFHLRRGCLTRPSSTVHIHRFLLCRQTVHTVSLSSDPSREDLPDTVDAATHSQLARMSQSHGLLFSVCLATWPAAPLPFALSDGNQ